MPDPTPAEILALPLGDNNSGATTVRGFIVAMAAAAWDGRSSPKNLLGDSDWRCAVDKPFIEAGWVAGSLDEDGWADEVDSDAVDRLVRSAIAALGETP